MNAPHVTWVPYDENLLEHQVPLDPISEWQAGEWDGMEEAESCTDFVIPQNVLNLWSRGIV